MIHPVLTDPHAPRRLRDSIAFHSDVSSRGTRAASAGHLQLPRVRTELARHFYSFRATALWNRAPNSVRTANSTNGCSKKAQAWLREGTSP